MGTHMGHVFTLANSIIGVSVLAMPFCFKQCGILLSILMLLLSSHISRLACHYLMKSAIIERMKNFEMLAFRVFGPTGKLIVEMCIIGFMLGTCVAFFVVIGDLGPNILGPVFGLEHPSALRPSVLIGTAVFVVLPLGLLRNVDSLNGICAVSLAFYGVLVLKVFFESSINLFNPAVWSEVYFWRPSGILRCVPIFSMALSCQTQLFEIFGSVPTTPLDRANAVVKSAVNLTTFFYISVGFFGYVAYADSFLTGNVMMNFSSGASSDIIKICFLLSVAVSFPLVIFPCRASIYSFLYSKSQHSYEGFSSAHIPETRFQCITLIIVTSSLVIGLLIPNIELVLGLVGSTLGVFICVITPGVIFTTVSFKRNNERLLAQILVGAGVVIMVLGTYANLYATEEALTAPAHKEVPEVHIKQEMKIDSHPHHLPDLHKDLAKMENVLKQLKREEDIQREQLSAQKVKLLKEKEMKMEEMKNVSPNDFSDQNPQPHKVDEGAKPQPVAPEPPEVHQKKIPINIPESLQNLENNKKVEEATVEKKKSEPFSALKETPGVIKKAVYSSGVMEKIAAAPKTLDHVEAAPAEVSHQLSAIVKQDEQPVVPLQESQPEKPELPPSKNKQKALPEAVKSGKKPEESKTIVASDSSLVGLDDKSKKLSAPNENDVLNSIAHKAEVEPKQALLKDNLSLSMAQGVPLPLAIKGLEKKEQFEDNVKPRREILGNAGGDVELREKRDLEAFEKEEAKLSLVEKPEDKTIVSQVEIASVGPQAQAVQPDSAILEGKLLVKSGGEDTLKLVSQKKETILDDIASKTPLNSAIANFRPTLAESSKDQSSASKTFAENSIKALDTHNNEPPQEKYVDKHEEDEECPKTTGKTDEKVVQVINPSTPLIKTPSKLTNENSVLSIDSDPFLQLKEPKLIINDHLGKQKK